MALAVGEIIGQYQVVGQIGQGGMATVYRAHHTQLDRYVAIKVMHQAYLDDENFLARFKREAQIIARLEHPHIVPVYDYSEYQGQPYLVMKLIEGRTLKSEIATGALPFDQLLDTMGVIAAALTYAHERGVLHRDMKPSNVIVEANTRHAYITDFGLARLVQSGSSTLSQDMLIGTPHYMSPEQAKGNQELGPGTDIYALGVMLYELAVGRVPFSGNTPYAIVHDHIYTPLPLPTSINPAVPPAVEVVLLKALAKDPAERYQTAIEMVSAFSAAVQETGFRNSGAPAQPAPPPPPQRKEPTAVVKPAAAVTVPETSRVNQHRSPTKPATRRRSLPMLALVAALLLVCGAALTLVNRGRSVPQTAALPTLASLSQPAPTVTAPQTALTLYDVPQRSIEEANAVIERAPDDPVGYIALAGALWRDDQMPEAQATLREGLSLDEQKVIYLLSAAFVADEAGKITTAVILNTQALNLSQSDPNLFPPVRALVGEYLYSVALEPGKVNLAEVERALRDSPTGTVSPIFNIMSARLLIADNRARLAETALRRLSVEASTLAEAQLVQGELYLAQGDTERALATWRGIENLNDAPQWVQQRALVLIQSITGA